MPATSPPSYDAESLLRALMENVPGAIYRCTVGEPWVMRHIGAESESITGYPVSDFIDAAVRTYSSAMRAAERLAEQGADAGGLLQQAREELDAGLDELRELARGIHPALLTDHGLVTAVQALASRCSVPVELHDALGERLPPVVEAAFYYTVSEALTNVVRYAQASRVTVRFARVDGIAELTVADDGRGGADPATGSGLRGLEDRLSALGGGLEIDSPPRGGTRLIARAPVH